MYYNYCIKQKEITVRQKKPWFSEEIRSHKKEVRKQENIWRKYRSGDSRNDRHEPIPTAE